MKAIYIDRNAVGGSTARRPVSTIMSRPAVCVQTSTTLGDALQTMVLGGLRHLVVIDAVGQCAGILSDRTIASAWAADPACLSYRLVSAAVERSPATISASSHVVDVARLMRTAGTDAVAVVDAAGNVAGIVTASDMIALLAR